MPASSPPQTRPIPGTADAHKNHILSTFRFKVILSTFIVVLLLVLSGFIFFLVSRIFDSLEPAMRADLEWKTRRGAVELSQSADLGIALGDIALIEKTFADFRTSADVMAVVAQDAVGKTLVSQGTPPGDIANLFRGEALAVTTGANHLVTWAPSIIEGNAVGRVAVVVSTARLEAGQRLRRNILGTVGIGVVLALGVSLFFVNFYLAPLISLTQQGLRTAGELEIAKRIQTSILPKKPELAGFELAAIMIPATEVGGDYYDVIPADDGAWVAIGDVAGHGVQAGLIMMMAQSVLSALVRDRADTSPRAVITTLNEVLYENIRHRLGSDEHLTFSLLRTFSDGRVVFAGAHEEMLVVRAETGTCERIATMGAWLGAIKRIAAATREDTFSLSPGDVLLLHTDGITEARSASGELFGIDRLAAVALQHKGASAAVIHAAVMTAVHAFMSVQDDDMTLVVMRRNGSDPA